MTLGPAIRTSAVALVAPLLWAACDTRPGTPVVFGVPTTVQDSGLLEALRSEFERAHPEFRLRVVAGGSGELLALAARGDLDILLSHAPEAEREFMEGGLGRQRIPIMENDFVIVGPPNDPAGVSGLHDPVAALARIAASNAPFVSRGDDSGTHRKELELRPVAGGTNYRAVGQGMGETLRVASEMGGYTLSDRATFRNLEASLELVILLEGDDRLRNVYSVIVPARVPESVGVRTLTEWLTSESGRRVIRGYGEERFGRPLFVPY